MSIPDFIYGTAWKEEASERLTLEALEAGFSAVDTANQRKHYHEEGVGKGIQRFLKSGRKKREELFIQTKFTYARGQDHRKPYDEDAACAVQVKQSFSSSLEHLGLDYLDSLILHSPFGGDGIDETDWEVWAALEELQKSGKTRFIGISNVRIGQLKDLAAGAKIKPAFVQNRCYARRGWDKEVRVFCRENGIFYQGFSLLTANQDELQSGEIRAIAEKHGKTIPQIVFRFSQQSGMIPLTGTTDAGRMRQDLDIDRLTLTAEELRTIEGIGGLV